MFYWPKDLDSSKKKKLDKHYCIGELVLLQTKPG